jgi:pimeloyl-ACP methyl ester carboxylesterase
MVALAPTLTYDISLISDLPPLERARQLRIPTLIMVGEKSPASLHDVASQLSQAIPHAQCSQLAGQDHMADPTVLLPLLTGFLAHNEIGDK